MRRSPRVNYDLIAALYDTQPYREKTVDPELSAFISRREPSVALAILDVGCGTGNQLVANRTMVPYAELVGLDRSLGMLRQAQPKTPDIKWVQADGAILPFKALSFDFVTCRHALHHVQDKTGMLRESFRVLRAGGRLVLHSLCPKESADWLYYEYFPEARAVDLKDFWSAEDILAAMGATGFVAMSEEYRHLDYEQNLRTWLDIVRRRDTCSQLQAIPDAAYAAGLRRLEQELADGSAPPARAEHLCLVTIRGEKALEERL